jgi:hypothetical protein
MGNLSLATPILPQRVVAGGLFELSFHVHEDGQNFNWSGYTPKAHLEMPGLTMQYTGTVINQAGGTAKITLTRAATQDYYYYAGSFAELLLFADGNSTKRPIAVVQFQIAAGEIP